MIAESINFWLEKFVQDVRDKKGQRNPGKTYQIIQGIFLIPYTGGAFSPVGPFHFPTTEGKKGPAAPQPGPFEALTRSSEVEKYKFLIV